MSQRSLRPEEVGLVNRQIALLCCAGPLALGYGMCGVRRIWCGPKYSLSIKVDGSMSIRAKKPGTNREYTLKV